MSDDLAPASHAEIALDGLIRTLALEGAALPESVPPDCEALDDGERRVLGFLLERARARGRTAADPPEPESLPDDTVSTDAPADAEGTREPDAETDVTEPPSPPPAHETADGSDHPDTEPPDAEPERTGPPDSAPIPDPDDSEDPDMRLPTRGGAVPLARPEPDRVNLRNGKARQDYAARIEGYADIVLRDDGGTDLSVAPDGAVSGGPMAAGDYTLCLAGRKAGKPVEIHARLSVIPDPRDLWKTLPSDRDDPHWKPDEAFDMAATGDALVVAASKRGRSHAQEGLFRDDDFAIRAEQAEDWHFLVVADGAGSAPLSREGSRIACRTALDALATRAEAVWPAVAAALEDGADEDDIAPLLGPPLIEAAHGAARAIEDRAAALERETKDFLTTLVVVLTRRIGARWLTATFAVGDGGAAVFDAQAQTVRVLCRPDSGEFAGQTRFLSADDFEAAPDDIASRVFVDIRPRFTVLAAMTDGITDPKFPTDAVFADPEAWATFWAEDLGAAVDLRADNPELQYQMTGWLDFWSRGNHDDRTLAVLVPADAG